ncbi:MAG: hypothetical protein AAF242_05055 [Bacteroidota bacterium]
MIILEIIIATAFFFFLLSTLVSGIVEASAMLLNKRGRELKRAITLVLNDIDPELAKEFYQHPLIKKLAEKPKWDSIRGVGLKLFNIFRLTKAEQEFPPSYISSKLFSRALADVMVNNNNATSKAPFALQELQKLYSIVEGLDYHNYKMLDDILNIKAYKNNPNEKIMEKEICKRFSKVKNEQSFLEVQKEKCLELRDAMKQQQIHDESDPAYFMALENNFLLKNKNAKPFIDDLFFLHSKDLAGWKGNVEQWYDQYMDRVSGWFKKRSHTNIFWIGLLVVIFFNLDVIAIVQALFESEEMRMQIMAQIDAFNQADAPAMSNQVAYDYLAPYRDLIKFQIPNSEIWRHLPGSLLTTFGIALGAPFWFDLFSRFSKLRAAGNKPEQGEG